MNKHTPGPWSYDEIALPFDAYVHAKGTRVASISDGPAYLNNALLIAAAPDLLAALENILRLSTWKTASTYEQEQLSVARAAIAKAKGE